MSKSHTALSAAFEKAGVSRIAMELHGAILRFKSGGGTIEHAHAIVDAAFPDLPGTSTKPSALANDPPSRVGTGQTRQTAVSSQRKRSAADVAAAKESPWSTLHNFRTRDGRQWINVCYHELDGLENDGVIARKIKNKIGVVTGKSRFSPISELLKPQTLAAIRDRAEKE